MTSSVRSLVHPRASLHRGSSDRTCDAIRAGSPWDPAHPVRARVVEERRDGTDDLDDDSVLPGRALLQPEEQSGQVRAIRLERAAVTDRVLLLDAGRCARIVELKDLPAD